MSGPAKHRAIEAALRARITGGRWPPGALIPGEAELAEEFGVTRPTVSRALRALSDAGLIERRRKAGTRVLRRSTRDAVLRIPLVREQIEVRGEGYRYLLLGREARPAPAEISAALGLEADAPALHVVCLHFAGARPWQLEDRWLNLDVIPQAEAEDFADRSPNEWLLGEVPYTSAEHVFRAARPRPDEARRLKLAEGEPVFVIERTTWLSGAAVTHVRLSHPGDSFSMVSRDGPEAAGGGAP